MCTIIISKTKLIKKKKSVTTTKTVASDLFAQRQFKSHKITSIYFHLQVDDGFAFLVYIFLGNLLFFAEIHGGSHQFYLELILNNKNKYLFVYCFFLLFKKCSILIFLKLKRKILNIFYIKKNVHLTKIRTNKKNKIKMVFKKFVKDSKKRIFIFTHNSSDLIVFPFWMIRQNLWKENSICIWMILMIDFF